MKVAFGHLHEISQATAPMGVLRLDILVNLARPVAKPLKLLKMKLFRVNLAYSACRAYSE